MTDGMRRRDDRLRGLLIALLVGAIAAIFVLWLRLSDVSDRLDTVETTTESLSTALAEFSATTTPATDSLLCALAFAGLPEESLQGLDPEEAFTIACPVTDDQIAKITERIEEAISSSTTTP